MLLNKVRFIAIIKHGIAIETPMQFLQKSQAMFACLKSFTFVCFTIYFISQNSYADTGPDDILQNTLSKTLEDDEEIGFSLNEAEMTKFHIWPSGVIPYFIDDFSFDKSFRDNIRNYLDGINTVTGLRFIEIPRPPEDESSRWVFFVNRIGQLSCTDVSFDKFTNEGVQKVVLGYDCLAAGGLAEIILSLVGVPPQHNSPDRDENIQINRNNIIPDKLYLFEILKNDEWLFYDLPYDIYSAGHYSTHRYTLNGGDTISIRQNDKKDKEEIRKLNLALGKWQKGMSTTDIKKIKMLYNYISKQKDTPNEMSGCKKLFSQGRNYGNYNSNVNSKLKSRKKPKKYLDATGQKDVDELEKDDITLGKDDETLAKEDKNLAEDDELLGKENDTLDNDNITLPREDKTLTKDNNNRDDLSITEPRPIDAEKKLLKHVSMSQMKGQILEASDYKTDDEGS